MRSACRRRTVGLKAWSMIGPGSARCDQVRPGREIEVRQVGAGAETAAGAGDDQRAYRRIGFGPVERGPQVLVHLAVETVQRLRAVQRDDGHRALLGVQHCRVGHVVW